ncbi:MAG: site-2 protease family protein [Epsilonproteobacteria bacterium]|nr:site-2 protease family protein [Campylobacterota bacterium]
MMYNQQLLALTKDIAIAFPAFLLVFSFRGFFQALIAKVMGDDTAQEYGFLTLNPLAHIDLMGLCAILLFFFFASALFPDVVSRTELFIVLIILGVRWTIPVPVNDLNFKHYRIGGILTSLAGPLSNFMLATLLTIFIKYTLLSGAAQNITVSLIDIFRTTLELAIFFGLLDLIPLPPFDGGRALRYTLPQSLQPKFDALEEYSLIIILLIFVAPGVNDLVFAMIGRASIAIKKILFTLFLS